jgi:hypothetical protein
VTVYLLVSTKRSITLELDPEDYDRLEAEARDLGVPPVRLLDMYVHASLTGGDMESVKQRQAGLAALDRLAELTEDLPRVDALQVARQSREELERRFELQ